MKPKIAFFDFACCEGCQLQVVNLEAEMLDLLGAVDIVQFREAMTEKSDDYDIAFVEGSITREKDIPRLKKIREQAAVLVALGACATIGGVNCLKNFQPSGRGQKIRLRGQGRLVRDLCRPAHRRGGPGRPLHPRLPDPQGRIS